MATLDWITLALYLCGIFLLSWKFRKQQGNAREYYLAGNHIGPLPIALSTAATQCSTNSLMGAPAFVAFSGGFLWLQYELAVPLAMAILLLVFFPLFRRLQLLSVYDYIEQRFGVPTRLVLSVLFQLLRAFSTGVTVYGISLVLERLLGFPFFWAVMLLGVFTILYDVIGGMKAVIWSDVIQLGVLFCSILLACWIGISLNGGWSATWETFAATGKQQTIDFNNWGFDGDAFGFWPMLLGGLFLYVSYYGCDQTQAQRELSTRDVEDSRRSLLIGGLIRFPLVMTYCFLGACLAAYISNHPDFIQLLTNAAGETEYNLAVPVFVLEQFPVIIKGIVIAGLFAAAMSSLDSTINALSLLTYQDVVERIPAAKAWSEQHGSRVNRLLTVFWGIVCLLFAFQVSSISTTIIESVNKIGSLINGPLLGVFVLGFFVKKVGQVGALLGLFLGFITNVLLWKFAPDVSWLWWNPIGFFVTCLGGLAGAVLHAKTNIDKKLLWLEGDSGQWQAARRYVFILVGYCVAVFVFLIGLGL